MQCTNCRSEIEEHARFCSRCGAESTARPPSAGRVWESSLHPHPGWFLLAIPLLWFMFGRMNMRFSGWHGMHVPGAFLFVPGIFLALGLIFAMTGVFWGATRAMWGFGFLFFALLAIPMMVGFWPLLFICLFFFRRATRPGWRRF